LGPSGRNKYVQRCSYPLGLLILKTADNDLDAIHQAAQLLHGSLARYLAFAKPWHTASQQDTAELINQIAEEQIRWVRRLVEVLEENGRPVWLTEFPLEYTALNDLSITYLLTRLRQDLASLIRELTRLATEAQPGDIAANLLSSAVEDLKSQVERLKTAV